MSDTTLLFLHGVTPKGAEEPERRGQWQEALFSRLTELGYENLDSVEVIAPEYSDLLRLTDIDSEIPMPPLNKPRKGKQEILEARRRYDERLSALEMKIGHNLQKQGIRAAEPMMRVGVNVLSLTQAKTYMENENIRAHVLARVLEQIPSSGNIVIIGHSLGSVIAADLIRRLPEDLKVDGMVTIGSPLGNSYFSNEGLRKTLSVPPANLGWWINFWGKQDIVSASRGVSSTFPWVLDKKVNTGALNTAHSSSRYLDIEIIAKVVGVALLGSTNRTLQLSSTAVDVPFSQAEWPLIAGLRFIYLMEVHLRNAKKQPESLPKLIQARKFVQHRIVSGMIREKEKAQVPIPSALPQMCPEIGSDPGNSAPEPVKPDEIAKEDALKILPLLFSENLLQPFEIEIDPSYRKAAIKDFTAEMGYTSTLGEQILSALEKVDNKLSDNGNSKYFKYGFAGAGFAAIVVATGGLALAAAPGVAGAAMVTSALAAFGPGGMIGGLVTSGTLIGVGSGTVGLSLSNPQSSATDVEGILLFPLVEATLRKELGFENSNEVWYFITEEETNLRREFEHLSLISDSGSSSIKTLEKKLVLIERALDYLTGLGIGPEAESFDEEVPKAIEFRAPKFLSRGKSD